MGAIRMDGRCKDSYLELIKQHPLVSISNEQELDESQRVIEELLQRDLDPHEESYLEALSDLVAHYEEKHWSIGDATGAEVLEHLIEARGITQRDVAEGAEIHKSKVSEILSGKRQINLTIARKLAKFFAVGVGAFISEQEDENEDE